MSDYITIDRYDNDITIDRDDGDDEVTTLRMNTLYITTTDFKKIIIKDICKEYNISISEMKPFPSIFSKDSLVIYFNKEYWTDQAALRFFKLVVDRIILRGNVPIIPLTHSSTRELNPFNTPITEDISKNVSTNNTSKKDPVEYASKKSAFNVGKLFSRHSTNKKDDEPERAISDDLINQVTSVIND